MSNTDPFVDFCLARQAMLHAYRAWVMAEAENAVTSMEIDGTISALRQIHALEQSKVG